MDPRDQPHAHAEWLQVFNDAAPVAVVLADGDYPGSVTPGKRIEGADAAAARPDVYVYHMGTRRRDGHLETAGGRVLCVVGRGDGLAAAQRVAYEAISDIRFEGMRYRKDIGWRELRQAAAEAEAEEVS